MLRTLYFTATSRDTALQIARKLIEERLVACANVLDGATSVFHWEGEVREETEAVVFAKTTADRAAAAMNRVQQLHEYDCPCVVAWDVDAAPETYHSWVATQTTISRQR